MRMKKFSLLIIVSAFILNFELKADTQRDSLTVSPFGKIFIYKQTGTPENVIIMISGDGGWKYGVVGFSETFSERFV